MFAKRIAKKTLTKHSKETLRSVLFAAKGYNNGETNCCNGKIGTGCHNEGDAECCNGAR